MQLFLIDIVVRERCSGTVFNSGKIELNTLLVFSSSEKKRVKFNAYLLFKGFMLSCQNLFCYRSALFGKNLSSTGWTTNCAFWQFVNNCFTFNAFIQTITYFSYSLSSEKSSELFFLFIFFRKIFRIIL